MTTSDKLLVVKTQDWVIRVEEFWVEDDLDPIGGSVEQLDPSDLVQDWVIGVIGHVVRHDGWEGVSLQGEDSSLEEDLVLGGQQVLGIGNLGSVFTKPVSCCRG